MAVEDEGELTEWALALESEGEKTGWLPGVALRYQETHYRLHEVVQPLTKSERWSYRFAFWPAGEILRLLIDYDQDAAERASARNDSLVSRVRHWIPGLR